MKLGCTCGFSLQVEFSCPHFLSVNVPVAKLRTAGREFFPKLMINLPVQADLIKAPGHSPAPRKQAGVPEWGAQPSAGLRLPCLIWPGLSGGPVRRAGQGLSFPLTGENPKLSRGLPSITTGNLSRSRACSWASTPSPDAPWVLSPWWSARF